jgi:hypothetical protein
MPRGDFGIWVRPSIKIFRHRLSLLSKLLQHPAALLTDSAAQQPTIMMCVVTPPIHTDSHEDNWSLSPTSIGRTVPSSTVVTSRCLFSAAVVDLQPTDIGPRLDHRWPILLIQLSLICGFCGSQEVPAIVSQRCNREWAQLFGIGSYTKDTATSIVPCEPKKVVQEMNVRKKFALKHRAGGRLTAAKMTKGSGQGQHGDAHNLLSSMMTWSLG